MFGRAIVHAAFEYEQVRSFELDELRATAHAAVEHDPDDLWNQLMSHDDVLAAIDAASTFGDLVRALSAARGLLE
jgi:hypothetical protein